MKSEYHGCNFLDTHLDMDVVDTFHHLDKMVSEPYYFSCLFPPPRKFAALAMMKLFNS